MGSVTSVEMLSHFLVTFRVVSLKHIEMSFEAFAKESSNAFMCIINRRPMLFGRIAFHKTKDTRLFVYMCRLLTVFLNVPW